MMDFERRADNALAVDRENASGNTTQTVPVNLQARVIAELRAAVTEFRDDVMVRLERTRQQILGSDSLDDASAKLLALQKEIQALVV